jgi:hypothetical protein
MSTASNCPQPSVTLLSLISRGNPPYNWQGTGAFPTFFVRATVYLPKQMHRDLKSAAAQSGQEISEIVESPSLNTSSSLVPIRTFKQMNV